MSQIIINNLSKKYGDKCVLNNFNAKFKDSNTYYISGESGKGKTTLIRIIIGLEKPDSGEIISDCRYSVVFQENRLLDGLDVLSNIRFVIKKKYSDNELKKILSEILPTDCLLKKVSQLSGGMKRRVAIARAMLAESDVVIFDEPYTGLDSDTICKTVEFIKKYRKERMLIIVTHDKNSMNLIQGSIYLLTSDIPIGTI